MSGSILLKKYIGFYNLMTLISFFMVIQMIGGILTAVVHNVGVAIVFMSVVVNKKGRVITVWISFILGMLVHNRTNKRVTKRQNIKDIFGSFYRS